MLITRTVLGARNNFRGNVERPKSCIVSHCYCSNIVVCRKEMMSLIHDKQSEDTFGKLFHCIAFLVLHFLK